MKKDYVKKIKEISSEKLLDYANIFRSNCANIPACTVTNNALTYRYIPMPLTDGPVDKETIDNLSILIVRGLLDRGIDFDNHWAVAEADRGGAIVLRAVQSITGINIHWANWYDEATMKAFGNDFLSADMEPPFAMGTSLKPGLYLPKELRKTLQKKGVILLDDIVSSGRTLITLNNILKEAGISLKAIACGAEKVDYNGGSLLRKAFPSIPVLTIAKIRIRKLTDKEKDTYKYNPLITGMSETTGTENTPYYLS